MKAEQSVFRSRQRNLRVSPIGDRPAAPPAGAGEGGSPARYARLRRLGSGGMGVVYEALDLRSGRRVAIKTLPCEDPNLLYRLKREFRSLVGVRHPNLVRLHELVADESGVFFSMDLIDGECLIALGLAGSLASAGLGPLVGWLVARGYVDVIASTSANATEDILEQRGVPVYRVDADHVDDDALRRSPDDPWILYRRSS